MRVLELPIDALERLLRAHPLGNVVDHHEARAPPAPADQVAHAVDVDRLAVLACMAEDTAINRAAGLVAQEIAALVGPAKIEGAHGEEFLAGVSVKAQRSIVHRQELEALI